MSSEPQDSRTRAKESAISWATGALLVVLLLMAWWTIDILLLIFAGILFGVLLGSLTQVLCRFTRLPWPVALAAVCVMLVAIAAGTLLLLGATLIDQLDALGEQIPQALRELRDALARHEWGQRLLQRLPTLGEILPERHEVVAPITGILTTTFGIIVTPILVAFLGLFLAAQPEWYMEGTVLLFPPRHRDKARLVLREMGSALSWWLIGKIGEMVLVGVLTYLALRGLRIPLATGLAVLAGVLSFVPNFGPVIAAVPAVLLGLVIGPWTGLWVTITYIAIQMLEGYIITPLVQQRFIQLPAAVVISAQVLMGALTGALGVALATPLTAGLAVIVRRVYVQAGIEKRSDIVTEA